MRAALEFCREGDGLVAWKPDRSRRSLQELIEFGSGGFLVIVGGPG